MNKLEDNTLETRKWIKNDLMIRCWFLNTMSKELPKAFMYAKSSRELWSNVNEHFGMTSGPLVHQLQFEIVNLKQITFIITEYFNKLKRLWDELSSLCRHTSCECRALK